MFAACLRHGITAPPAEFKELRKQWRMQKKEAEEAERERERQERLGFPAIPTHQHPHAHTQNSGMQPYNIYHPVSPVVASVPVGMAGMGGMSMGGVAVSLGMGMGGMAGGMQNAQYGYMQQQQQRTQEYYGSQRDNQAQYAHGRDYTWGEYSPSSQPQVISSHAQSQQQSQAQAQCAEYEDYSTAAAPRRGSMAGVPYPLSPVSLYSATSGRSSISSAPGGGTDEGFSQ